MNILTIDTSTGMELVAVTAPGGSADLTGPAGASHSVTLFARIDAALAKAGIAVGAIDLVGVGIGPGSFTGIRIAVSTARMLAQVLAKPLAGIHSPLIWAASMEAAPGDYLLPAFDAKKGRVFGALYRRTADPLAPDVIIHPGDHPIALLARGVTPGSRLLVAGQGLEKWEGDITAEVPGAEILHGFVPSGITACALTARAFADTPSARGDFTAVVPFYARKSDAEVAMELKTGAGQAPAR